MNIKAGAFTGAYYVQGSLSITGGTFSSDPSDYVATGYRAVENEDLWEVKVVPLVAKIGNDRFTSLADAIEVAKTVNDPVITLIADVELPNETLWIDFPITIDGNGYTISRKENSDSTQNYLMYLAGTATLKNITIDAANMKSTTSWTIYFVGPYDKYSWSNKAVLTLDGVTFKNSPTKYVVGTGSYVKIVSKGETKFFGNAGSCFEMSSHDKELEILGGEYYSNKNSVIISTSGSGANSTKITISGGKFYNNTAELGAVLYSKADTKLHFTLSGGEFYNNTAKNGAVIYYGVVPQSGITISHPGTANIHDNTNTENNGVDLFFAS